MRRIAVILVAFVALLSVAAVQLHGPGTAQAVSYAPGWNLVAGPQGARLTGATGQIYTIQPGDADYQRFPANAPLTACVGYWAYFPTGGSIDFGPFGAASVNCAVGASNGQFFMVGNPSGSASITLAGADLAYTYAPDTGYQSTTQLSPGQGAWVSSSGVVKITTSATVSARPAAAPALQVAAATHSHVPSAQRPNDFASTSGNGSGVCFEQGSVARGVGRLEVWLA